MILNQTPPAAAIILAGGNSTRMRCDKALLPVQGIPMIAHIHAQLALHFGEIIVSANAPEKYAFLAARFVPDKAPGQGPLLGVLSALEASHHELNFVVACDVPVIDMALVTRLLCESEGFDAVVPVDSEGLLEPLFAVYRKSMIPILTGLWQTGNRRMRDAYEHCTVNYVTLNDDAGIENINTPDDYAGLVSGKRTGKVA